MVELLLVRDIDHLGKRGMKVRVREGYARNFLIPTGAAVSATADNVRRIEKVRAQWLAEEAKLLAELQELAARLAGFEVTLVAKASEAGNLYGSIGVREIVEASAAKGFPLEARVFKLAGPVKLVGDHAISLVLHDSVQVSMTLKVRAEGRGDWVPGQETPEAPTSAV
ncbi:MAG: 50S ribosomal protein L9 [Planctomycetes bacterium]|nr:50S ribosomal protein L9 [Planctomycetota bacterium]